MSVLASIAVLLAAVTLTLGSMRIARWLSRVFELRALGAGALAMALGMSTFLVATGLFGRLFGRFDAGLWAAALAGLALFWASRRLPEVEPGARPRLEPKTRLWFWAAVLSMTAMYADLSFRYQMHDEHAIFGHKAMIEELRHGSYPVYAPPFPDREARYHYGFDVLAGALARGFGASSDLSIDLVTILLALFMSWAAAALAVEAGAERSAPFAAVAIHLGAGLAAFMLAGVPGRHPRCLIQYHHPSCGMELFPTQLLNVFQHPVAAGVPLFLVFVLIAPKLRRIEGVTKGPRLVLSALAVMVLAALALSQYVYYALASLAFMAAFPLWLLKDRAKTARAILVPILSAAAVLAAAFALSRALGGMTAPNDTIDPNLVLRRTVVGFPEGASLAGILRHHAGNLGLAFVLIPLFAFAALWERKEQTPMLLFFALGGIAVAHLYTYARSWDIVKFPSASSFALSMLFVAVVDARLSLRPFPWTWLKRGLRLLVIGTGGLAALYLLFPLAGDNRPYDLGDYAVDPVIKKCIDWWWSNGYRKEELIYVQSNIAQQLAVFGGLSVVAQDADLSYLGVKQDLFYAQLRNAAEIRHAMSPEALDALGVVWVMFSDEELQNLGPEARRAIEEDRARFELEATFAGTGPLGRRRIWRVLGAKASARSGAVVGDGPDPHQAGQEEQKKPGRPGDQGAVERKLP